MKIVTWIIQGLLAVAFIMAGVMKSTQSIEQLSTSLPWVKEVSPMLVRFIGVSELAGGLGLILPWLTGIQRRLTPLAGWGLALVMVLAAVFHISRGEYPAILINGIMGGLAAFVANQRGKELKAAG